MKFIVLSTSIAILASSIPALASVHSPLRASFLAASDEDLSLVQEHHRVHSHHRRDPISINTSDVSDIAESAWSSASDEEKERNAKPEYQWTTTEPDSTDFNEETYVAGWPWSIESTCATLLCLGIASAPVVLAAVADEKLTRTHMLESVALIAWLGGVLYLFTSVLKFQSVHWDGYRPLTIVEAVYLLSQILTTVGYGDITPAFPRGQVWVGLNVVIGLLLYGSIVMEVVGICYARIEKHIKKSREEAALQEVAHAAPSPLKDWEGLKKIDFKPMVEASIFFGTMATIGIMFFHFKAGEDRTWLQAVYMSVITLSTVGFGAFTPVTEAGKVFGALWMLMGVSALAALITSFVDLMMRMKTVQHVNMQEESKKFAGIVDMCTAAHGGEALDKADFLKMAMMLRHGISESELRKIEDRFLALGPDANGNVSLDKVDQAERPPLHG